MTENPLDQSTLVLNWTKGPQQGRSLNILKKKCLLKWRSAQTESTNETPVPALAILQGPAGVALRSFGDAIMLNGIMAESHWLRHGDLLVHDRFEAQIEFRLDQACNLSNSYSGSIDASQPWDRLHELLEQMGNAREHSNRMTRKIKSLAKQTRQIAKHCQRLDTQFSESNGQSLQAINEKLDAVWDKLIQLADRPVANVYPETLAPVSQSCEQMDESLAVGSDWQPAVESDSQLPATQPTIDCENVEQVWQSSDSPFANLTQDWQVEELTWHTKSDEQPVIADEPRSDVWNVETDSTLEFTADSNSEVTAELTEESTALEPTAEEAVAIADQVPVESTPSMADMWNSQEQQFAELEQHLVAEVEHQLTNNPEPMATEDTPVDDSISANFAMADMFGEMENAASVLAVVPPVTNEPPTSGDVDLESILKRLRQIETNFQQEQDRNSTMCLNDSCLVNLMDSQGADRAEQTQAASLYELPTIESFINPAASSEISLGSTVDPVEALDPQSSLAWLTSSQVTEKSNEEAEQKVEILSQLYDSAIQGNHENDAWSQLMQLAPTSLETNSTPSTATEAPESAAVELSDFFASLSSSASNASTEDNNQSSGSDSPFDSAEIDPALTVGEISNESNRSELSRLRADLASLFNTDAATAPVKDFGTLESVSNQNLADDNSGDVQFVESDLASEMKLDSPCDHESNNLACLPTMESQFEWDAPAEQPNEQLAEQFSEQFGEQPTEQPAEQLVPEATIAEAVVPAPTYVPPTGSEHDDGVTNYMNQLFQRLRVNPASAGASPAPVKPQAPVAPVIAKTEAEIAQEVVESIAANRTDFMAPDEFKPKQQAPERNTDMNALRNLANASVRSALDEFAEKQKHGLAALRYATAGGGLAFSVVLFAASNGIGDIWFLGGCGCIFAAIASFVWHYHVAMQEAKKELISSGDLDEQNAQTRLEARLAVSVQEPTAEKSADSN